MKNRKKRTVSQSDTTSAAVANDNDIESQNDWMVPGDEEILQGVDENGEESVLDIEADGKDIAQSEIFGFLKKLNIDKYQPFQSSSVRLDSSDKTQENVKSKTSNSTEVLQIRKTSPCLDEDRKVTEAAIKYLKTFKSRSFLLIKPGEMWRDEKATIIPEVPSDEKLVQEAEKLAQRLLTEENDVYIKQRENVKRSEARWLKTVLSTGTLSDKMAAVTLLIQESPLHNMNSLELLITMARKKGKREAMMAIDTLRDLFLTGLLPDDRKLRTFKQHTFTDLQKLTDGKIEIRDKLLIMWYFESLLKRKYEDYIKVLGELSFDTLSTAKERAIATAHRLLTSKPEQENILLPMLVNKLGDPTVKSKTMYLLTKLVDEHPNMKPVIIREVQQLLYRPNISQRAQYYAICFLTQLRLSPEQSSEASQLINIYFYFFKNYLNKGEVDNKTMSALLTGVNRAFVYAEAKKTELVEEMDAVYKIIPSVNFHTGVQALMLLYQVTGVSSNASDRFYMSLYRKLGDPALKNSSKQAIFMNLLFKSLKRDLVDRRIKTFIKRILQVYSQQSPQIICGILILLSQILKDKPGLLDFKSAAKGLWEDDDEEEHFVDLPTPDEFNDSRVETLITASGLETQKDPDDKNSDHHSDAAENTFKGSWIHRKNTYGHDRSANYDPFGRNPLYSKADVECVWELQDLAKHYHPSVRLYASQLLKGESIQYDGDPLKDFTLIRFLDRFVYKNPKKQSEYKRSMSKGFKRAAQSGAQSIPVNSQEFLNMREDKVPDDQKFFHQYFVERAKKRQIDDNDSDADSVSDGEFEHFLDGFEKGADFKDDKDFSGVDLNFAGDKNKNQTQKGQRESDESGDSDSDDEDIDFEDDKLAAEFRAEIDDIVDDSSNDEEFQNSRKTFKDGEIEFSPDEDDDLKMMMMGNVKEKNSKKRSALLDPGREDIGTKKKRNTEKLFASAEEFAHLLEEDTELGKVSLGGLTDVKNTDKSSYKQLQWEADRETRTRQRKGFKQKRGNFKAKSRKGRFSMK